MYVEDAAGEFTLQNIFMLFVFFLVALTIFFTSYIESIDFKNYVDSQAEKNGGFTTTAMENIKNYSDQNFDGQFQVISLSGYDKKSWGGEIDYKIEGKVKILFFNIPDQAIVTRGSTISQVR